MPLFDVVSSQVAAHLGHVVRLVAYGVLEVS
jgi:hypothetical protein